MGNYLQLAIGGLFLQQQIYQQQRQSPERLKQGFFLVLLVGVVVGFSAMIGQIGETLSNPSNEEIKQTIYDGLTTMPWYQQLSESTPEFEFSFRFYFDIMMSVIHSLEGRSIPGALLSFMFTPFIYLLSWLISGFCFHIVARLLGGQATFSQTLGCTALASGANLLGVVQIVPFAQVSGTLLLSFLANYVAIREAHALAPWRAFWSVMLVPLLLIVGFLVIIIMAFLILPR